MIQKILAVFFACVFLSGCSTSSASATTVTVQEGIFVPEGYTFLDASAYGKYSNNVTYYCMNNETKRIYTCTDGQIGREIVLPEGYEFVGASAYGQYSERLTIYCRLKATGQVFKCKP